MLIVRALIPIMGGLLAVFGHLIVHKQKYTLINGFEDTQEGRRTALRIGKVELWAGALFLVSGCVLFFVESKVAVWITLVVLTVGFLGSVFAVYGNS